MGLLSILHFGLAISMTVSLVFGILSLALGLTIELDFKSAMSEYFITFGENPKYSPFTARSSDKLIPLNIDLGDGFEPGASLKFGAFILALTGGIMISYSIFGLVAALTKKTLLLALLIFMILGVLILDFVLLAFVVSLGSHIHKNGKKELQTQLRRDYQGASTTFNDFTFALNGVMVLGECCGIYGPADFLKLNLTVEINENGNIVKINPVFPPACCKEEFIDKGYNSVANCAKSKKLQDINQQGCYDHMFNYVREKYGTIMILISVFVIAFETFQMIMAYCIMLRNRELTKEDIRHVMNREKRHERDYINAGQGIKWLSPSIDVGGTTVVEETISVQNVDSIYSFVFDDLKRRTTSHRWSNWM